MASGQVPVQGQEEKAVQEKTACMELYPMWIGDKKANLILLQAVILVLVQIPVALGQQSEWPVWEPWLLPVRPLQLSDFLPWEVWTSVFGKSEIISRTYFWQLSGCKTFDVNDCRLALSLLHSFDQTNATVFIQFCQQPDSFVVATV